jgi:hypothetical protein
MKTSPAGLVFFISAAPLLLKDFRSFFEVSFEILFPFSVPRKKVRAKNCLSSNLIDGRRKK